MTPCRPTLRPGRRGAGEDGEAGGVVEAAGEAEDGEGDAEEDLGGGEGDEHGSDGAGGEGDVEDAHGAEAVDEEAGGEGAKAEGEGTDVGKDAEEEEFGAELGLDAEEEGGVGQLHGVDDGVAVGDGEDVGAFAGGLLGGAERRPHLGVVRGRGEAGGGRDPGGLGGGGAGVVRGGVQGGDGFLLHPGKDLIEVLAVAAEAEEGLQRPQQAPQPEAGLEVGALGDRFEVEAVVGGGERVEVGEAVIGGGARRG